MRKGKQFKEGDKVFAKVKGYPAWPALVLSKSGKKFNVQFYGTGETGMIKPEDISYYLRNKESLAKGNKPKNFLDAIAEIESAIAAAGGVDGDDGSPDDSMEAASGGKRKRSESLGDGQPKKKSGRKASTDSERDSASVASENPSVDVSTAGDEDASAQPAVEKATESKTTELPFLPEADLMHENDLKNWILYSDYVKEKPELYKSRPVEPRSHSERQVFPVIVSASGRYVGLKVHKNWPLASFTNEYDFAMYDYEAASRMLRLKEPVMSGLLTPETDPNSFILDFSLTDIDIKRNREMKLINAKYKRVDRLRTEATMIELDGKIKNCLGLNKADPKVAIGHLGAMLALDVDDTTLKKHHHVIEMIRRLRKYIGNHEEWNLNEDDLRMFQADAKKLREKADEVYTKFKKTLKLPEAEADFWESYLAAVQRFKEDCRYLTNREVFALCGDPHARATILDRLEQEEDLEEVQVRPETEKENSSDVANAEVKVLENDE